MKPKPILPYVTTPGLTVAYNRVREVATKSVDVTTACTILYGGAGSGKSTLIRKLLRDLAWAQEPAWYVERIRQLSLAELSAGRAVELARATGVVDDDNEEAFYALFNAQWTEDRRFTQPGEWVWGKLRFLADRLGRPRPDPLACLPLFGIHETVTHRLPILLEAMVKDEPSLVEQKLLVALGCNQERWHFRSLFLRDILYKLPIVLIVDEADTLHEDCLHSLRQLCDYSGTPLVLAGTDRLRARLLSTPALRPLATRVGMRIELGTVTLPDLRKSLPGMEQELVAEVFRQGGEYFRTICIILGGLRDFQDANPGRKITREIVQMVARRVLSATGLAAPPRSRTRQDPLVFTPEDLGDEERDPRDDLRAVEAPPAAARAARKAG